MRTTGATVLRRLGLLACGLVAFGSIVASGCNDDKDEAPSPDPNTPPPYAQGDSAS